MTELRTLEEYLDEASLISKKSFGQSFAYLEGVNACRNVAIDVSKVKNVKYNDKGSYYEAFFNGGRIYVPIFSAYALKSIDYAVKFANEGYKFKGVVGVKTPKTNESPINNFPDYYTYEFTYSVKNILSTNKTADEKIISNASNIVAEIIKKITNKSIKDIKVPLYLGETTSIFIAPMYYLIEIKPISVNKNYEQQTKYKF